MHKNAFRASSLLSAFAFATAAYGIPYTLTDLGANAYAYGINDIGTVVGHSNASNPNGNAVYWIGGVMSTISAGRAMSVNDNNVVAGTLHSSNDFAFTYNIATSTMVTPITTSPSFGYGINNAGTLSGWSAGAQKIFLASGLTVSYISAPSLSSIQTWLMLDPYGTGDSGNNINNLGYVTGNVSCTPPNPPPDGVFIRLGAGTATGAGPGTGTGNAINYYNHCAVERPNGSIKNAYFYNGTTFTLIGSSTVASTAHGINDSDMVVGAYNGYAYAWTPGGGLVDLNTVTTKPSNWNLIVARDVNNSGQIVGYALVTNPPSGPGQPPSIVVHAFLLTP